MRRLMVQAARMATTAEPPWPRTSTITSCDAPAKTIVESPTDAHPPRPSATGVAPATSPNGTTPKSIGAAASAPARASLRDRMAPMMAATPARPRRNTG